MKPKTYIETKQMLDWMTKNIPKGKESEFIREATRRYSKVYKIK